MFYKDVVLAIPHYTVVSKNKDISEGKDLLLYVYC